MHRGRPKGHHSPESIDDLTDSKFELAELTNQSDITGPIERALIGADVFIGVSAGNSSGSRRRVDGARSDRFRAGEPAPRKLAMARKYAAVIATGRSDYPNQINNVLAFPGIFCGAMNVRGIANHQRDAVGCGSRTRRCSRETALPATTSFRRPFDERVAVNVAHAVADGSGGWRSAPALGPGG